MTLIIPYPPIIKNAPTTPISNVPSVRSIIPENPRTVTATQINP